MAGVRQTLIPFISIDEIPQLSTVVPGILQFPKSSANGSLDAIHLAVT